MTKTTIEINLKDLKKIYKKTNNITKSAKNYAEKHNIKYNDSFRKRCSSVLKVNEEGARESEIFKKAKKQKVDQTKTKFIFSYAQNNTNVNLELLTGMEKLAEVYDAQILLNAGVYSNPNSFDNCRYREFWHPRTLPYLIYNEQKLHKYLSIITDADVLPTAEMPLRGFEGITGEESSLVGHPRQHFQVVATLPQQKTKLMLSSGSVTVPNYRRARVGKKAKFHHTMGFVVIEIFDEDNFTARHVSADENGNFDDLCYRWRDGKLSKDAKWDTVILGDLHLGHEDLEMLKETERLMEIMKPKHTLCHDIFDGRSVNHHASKDFVHQVVLNKQGGNCLQTEIDYMFSWVRDWKKWGLVIVPSNHDAWLDQWIRLERGRKDVKNAFLYNKFQQVLFNEMAPKGLVPYLIDQEFGEEVTTLHVNDSFKRKGFELNFHGDRGANGAKGTPTAFKKLNVKLVAGDKHQPYTLDGARGVGVSTELFHGYNLGLSSWVKSHGVIGDNGKFQHLIFTGGKFTTLL